MLATDAGLAGIALHAPAAGFRVGSCGMRPAELVGEIELEPGFQGPLRTGTGIGRRRSALDAALAQAADEEALR